MFDTFAERKFLLKQLVKKNLTSKYKDSVLGILWSFFNPLLIMIVFTAIFSMLFGRNIDNYPVYFLSGRLLYDFFSSGSKGAMNSIKRNAGILKKIYVPKSMFAVSAVCYEFVNFLISFLLVFGLGLILSVCNTYFSDIGYLYNVFTLVLMYSSALFYPIEVVPPRVQIIFTLNPVYIAISTFRSCVYGVIPDLGSLAYLAIFAFTVLFIGIILFRMYEKKLSLEL